MKNPFLDEKKGDPDRLDNGVIGKLRAQPTIRARILGWRPRQLTLGDFSLKTMYDEVLIARIKAGYYPEVTAALVADWGCPVHGCGCAAPDVADGNNGGKAPLAKAVAR